MRVVARPPPGPGRRDEKRFARAAVRAVGTTTGRVVQAAGPVIAAVLPATGRVGRRVVDAGLTAAAAAAATAATFLFVVAEGVVSVGGTMRPGVNAAGCEAGALADLSKLFLLVPTVSAPVIVSSVLLAGLDAGGGAAFAGAVRTPLWGLDPRTGTCFRRFPYG